MRSVFPAPRRSPPPPPRPSPTRAGWLQQVEASGRKRHRYFVLTPQYLSFFDNEDHAAISNDGFMQGVAEPAGSIAKPPEHLGVLVSLSNLVEAQPEEGASLRFRWLLKEPVFTSHAEAQPWMERCASEAAAAAASSGGGGEAPAGGSSGSGGGGGASRGSAAPEVSEEERAAEEKRAAKEAKRRAKEAASAAAEAGSADGS